MREEETEIKVEGKKRRLQRVEKENMFSRKESKITAEKEKERLEQEWKGKESGEKNRKEREENTEREGEKEKNLFKLSKKNFYYYPYHSYELLLLFSFSQ